MADEKNNTGDCNTGDLNTGHLNTGNWNTGDWNTGDWNTGDRNTGDCNTGDWNTGDLNTGRWNTGNWSTGDRNTGDRNTGDCNTGDLNTGDWNTGNWNTGNWNTGNWNTGNWNTGNCNPGNCNTGNWNTGNWNKSNYHTGCFNTIDAKKAYYFNRLIDKSDWDNADKPLWIFNPAPTTWIADSEMTDDEKRSNPTFHTCGGYLRKNDMREEWKKAYDSATLEDIELTRKLPAFDADVFLEITGIDLREPKIAERIVIDGVTYVREI